MKVGHPIVLNVPIAKIDEEKRMVYGYATVEEVDKHGEIIGYEASKKAFGEWPGNIREMHDPVAVGVNKEVSFDDDTKGVWIGAYVSESADGENAWTKVKEGVLQGFSIGGTIKDFKTIKGEDDKPHVMVTEYDLNEVSLVDNPACPSAMFQMVKSAKGGFIRTEKMISPARSAAWWENAFLLTKSQKVIKGANIGYNENSMGKQKMTLVKSLWEADTLIDLAQMLANYIWWQTYEGENENIADLKTALESIKQAAVSELQEPEDFPEVTEAIENACKALNITKKEELIAMAKEHKQATKSVVGSPDRDANADETVSAEVNGRPVNDTPERAEESGVPAAGTVVTDEDGNETVQPVVHDEASIQAANPAVAETPAPVTEEETDDEDKDEQPDDEDKDTKGKKGKKAAGASDIKKQADESELSKVIGGVIEKAVKAAVEPLQQEIDRLKKQPAVRKGKASYAEVEKAETVKTTEQEAKDHFDTLQKRADELAADPAVGTPQERIQLAVQLRKASRAMDPRSVAEAENIRAQFQTIEK